MKEMNMTTRNPKHLRLLAFALVAAALASAWLPLASSASAAQGIDLIADAKKGNGNGNGNGNGGGNGNGNGNGNGGGGELSVELQPAVWNTNYDHSAGTVSAVIRGGDLGEIDLDSIVLVGTDDSEEPVEALRATRQGNHIRVFFAKDDALASLDTPSRGEVHEVTIEFTMGEDDVETSLTDEVRIVGPGGGDGGGDDEVDLDLAIQADRWNVNWARSNGTVSALIRGEGLDDIDLDSIELVGTDPDAEPLPALRATRTGNHVRAFFAKDDAFATLDTPKPGEVHEIIIRLSAGGDEDEELTDRIRVVGPSR
jgi:uncharacterized membrane protein